MTTLINIPKGLHRVRIMNVDIAAHIERLLFLHDTLVIPGLGGFTASRTPASIDYANNTINPPAKMLTFSENLTTDDGLLVEDIAQSYSISLEEARRVVQAFVEQIQQRLNQRDIVSLPGVGRLYKNYLQKIQFLPDTTNFNANSYGLPPLQFSPIARSREGNTGVETPATTTVPAAEVTPPLVPPIPPLPNPPTFENTSSAALPRSSTGRFGLGIGIGLILCTAVFGLWWWQYRKDQPALSLEEQRAEMERAKPIPGLPSIAGLGQPHESDPSQKPKSTPSLPEIEEQDLNDEVGANTPERQEALERLQKEDQQAKALNSQRGRQCILIVATLSNPENADRLVAQLEGAGFTLYERKRGTARQVGISFYYTDPREIEQKKAELTQLTGEKGIFVKTK